MFNDLDNSERRFLVTDFSTGLAGVQLDIFLGDLVISQTPGFTVMVCGIVMGTIKEIITVYSCLEAVESAVLAKTGRKLLNRKKSLTKNGKFFFFFPITGNL